MVEKFGGVDPDGKLNTSKAYDDALKGINNQRDRASLENAISAISGRYREEQSWEKMARTLEKPVLTAGVGLHYAYSGLASIIDIGTPIARTIQEGGLSGMARGLLNTIQPHNEENLLKNCVTNRVLCPTKPCKWQLCRLNPQVEIHYKVTSSIK